MCIIWNLTGGDDPDGGMEVADAFLDAFDASRREMKRATDAMLAVSKRAASPEDRKRYDAIHKVMVRQSREWNKLEQKREHDSRR